MIQDLSTQIGHAFISTHLFRKVAEIKVNDLKLNDLRIEY